VARYSLTAGSNVTASSSFATATITPGAGRLVLAFVLGQKVGGPGTPTASGNGLTWQQVASVTNAGPGNSRITCFRAMGPAPSVGPLTFDFAGQQQQACAWSVFEYDNVDGSGTNGSGAVAQQQTASGSSTTLAAMLGPLADAAASSLSGRAASAAPSRPRIAPAAARRSTGTGPLRRMPARSRSRSRPLP